MNGYLAKPIDPDLMFEMIQDMACQNGESVTICNQKESVNNRIWNRKELLERVDYDENLLEELIEIFMRDLPTSIAMIGEAFASSEADRFLSEVHGLKGSAANISANAIWEKAVSIETAAGNNNWREVESLLADLCRGAALTQAVLEGKCSEAGISGLGTEVD